MATDVAHSGNPLLVVYGLENIPTDLVLHLPVSSEQARVTWGRSGCASKCALLAPSSSPACCFVFDALRGRAVSGKSQLPLQLSIPVHSVQREKCMCPQGITGPRSRALWPHLCEPCFTCHFLFKSHHLSAFASISHIIP